jgi:hypothetical protein
VKGVDMGLPAEVYERLHTALLRCDVFRNDDALAAVFVDARISQWAAELPEAGSKGGRVRATIKYLVDKHNAQEENALVLFLRVLSKEVSDSRHRDLVQLAHDVKQYSPAPDTPAWEAALQRYCAHVKALHGTMRVLGKPEPVSLAGLYTDVYLLEQPQAARGVVPVRADEMQEQRRDGLELLKQLGD